MATLSSSPSAGGLTESANAVDLFPPRDRQLLADCLRGQPAAWDAFIERFSGLFAFVVDRTAAQRQIPLSAADRDDLLADIMLEVLQRHAAVLRSFRGNSTLATYLVVVARRLTVRGLSKMAERRRVHAGTAADTAQVGRADEGPARVDDREQIEAMLSRLARSDPSGAEMLRLHHLEGRSYGEISRMTGMPLGSIGPVLARARQKMRERAE